MTKSYFKRMLPVALASAGFALSASAATEKLDPKQLEFFEKRIRPVLAASCYDCHSAAAKVKGGLVMDSKEGLLKGGDSGPAVVPGNPKKSLMVEAIEYHNKDLKMPPKEEDRLSEEQVADIVAWIQMGAPDPRAGSAPAMKAISIEESRKHWAFQPIQNPPVPKVTDKSGFVKSDIDRFLLAKMTEKGLTPSAPVDKRSLIRRAAYDLIGLPPTPEEVEDFLKDKSPNAFAKVVDRYLASPRYGERWGRHWLDVARYADNTGDRLNRGTPNYPFSWTFRDYVIDAFNKDKPFNQFIKEQIAADRVVTGDDKRDMAAMGFLTVGKRFMGNQQDVIDDRIDVVTQGFMGLTVSCARCHDHKFDPIPTKDYYSLHGVFNSSVEPEKGPFLVEPKDTPEYRDFKEKLAALEVEVAETGTKEYEKALALVRSQAGDILLANYRFGATKTGKELRGFLRDKNVNFNAYESWAAGLKKLSKEPGPVMKPWFDFAALSKDEFAAKAAAITETVAKDSKVNPLVGAALAKAQPKTIEDVAAAYGKLFKEIDKAWLELKETKAAGMKDENEEQIRLVLHDTKSPLYLSLRDARNLVGGAQIRALENRVQNRIYTLETTHPGSPTRAMVLQDAAKPRDSFVFIRGEATRKGDLAPRQFLQILSTGEPKKLNTGSGRIDLANAIADRNNPLTARVIVNRIWAKHFGEGLVRSISDFGLRAEQPVNLELLDHLATWFMDNGWSIKKLHRYMLLSGVYQQGSADNAKYEEVDPANLYLWKMPMHRLDFEAIRDTVLMHGGNIDLSVGGKPVDITDNPSPTRRTVYGYVDRFSLPEMFRTFDFANPDMTTSSRMPTTVPQQALFMMNSPFVIEQAKLMVQRTDFQARKTDQEKVKFLFQTLYQREPSASEISMAQKYLAAQASKDVKADEGKAAWSYGFGNFDGAAKQLRFRAFTDASANAYISNKKVGEASLNAAGGMPTVNPKIGVIRRWTAPKDGRVFISGPIVHNQKEGDGVVARIIGSRQGELGNWTVFNGKQDVTIEHVDVKAGDTIDFVVTCGKNADKDRFGWAPVIRMEDGPEWNARTQFALPDKNKKYTPLNSWEKLAQALFLTNELIYVN
jgi:mono/diheme cytochrome c family protein